MTTECDEDSKANCPTI